MIKEQILQEELKCHCGKIVKLFPSQIGRKKYCSKECFYKYRKRPSGLFYNIVRNNKGWFKKGNIPWIQGKKGIIKVNSGSFKKGEHRGQDTEFRREDVLGEKNNQWKGDNVGYYGIHTWLQNRYGKANRCENKENNILDFPCLEKSSNYDWALIKEKRYERKRKNFMMLCHSCHLKYDKQKSI
uniref:Nuclease associated modular domain-containing protein n=1 Tax=viral metagenome TaxID=1070528 RepID=A0A6M3MAW5_9ZZZZ